MPKSMGAAEFRNGCLQVLDQLAQDGEPVTITKRGRPVAVLTPIAAAPVRPLFGALKGSVSRYDDPFLPVTEPHDWETNTQ